MYVAVARKHIRLMVLLLCFCWLGAVVFYVYSRPVYMSRALVKTDIIDRNKVAEAAFQERARVASLAGEMTQGHIVERAAARLGVKASARDVAAHYIKKTIPRKNAENDIEVEVYSYSYDWANRWTETLVREYLDYKAQRRKTEMDQRTENYYADRKDLENKIEIERKRIQQGQFDSDMTRRFVDFQVLANTPYLLADATRKLKAIDAARIQIASPELDTVGRLSVISSVTSDLQIGTSIPQTPTQGPGAETQAQPAQPGSANSAPPAFTPLPPQVDNSRPESIGVVTPDISTESAWKGVVREINILKAKRQDLLRDKQPGHRMVLDVQEKLDALDLQLEGELKTALDRLAANYSQISKRISDLKAKIPEWQKADEELKRARDDQGLLAGTKGRWLTQLRLIEQNYENDLYAFDRDRIKLSYNRITQINENPVSPNRFGLLLYATILGLMLAVGVPFLIEYLDHTLSNLEEVEAAFQLRGLGIIPKLGNNEDQTSLLNQNSSKESNLLENFRVIRTNLLSMGSVTKPPHVVIVTSAMPKEGKTFVSSNLAMSFAQTGAKTLLIDTDLRRGRLHRLFGYRKQPGLSGVLLNQVTLEEAIRPTPIENLFMLSAGQHLETGTELLGSQRFIDILGELRKRFERIVMDTPPVLGLSETSILQNHVDGVLFVIWSGQTPIKSVKAAIEILQSNGANFYGFVLNRLDLSATANYYQYYYYSHDYYYQYTPRQLENS